MKGFSSTILGLLSCCTFVKAIQQPCKDCDFTSVVDVLSQSAMFSSFLRMLQRHGDIPTLNELQNFTLLAPVNTAFAYHVELENDADFDINNYILRDRVLETSKIDNGTVILHEGVKFPLTIRREESGVLKINEVTIVEPDLKPNFQNATVHGISELLADPPDSRGLVSQIDRESRDVSFFDSFARGFAGFDKITENNTLLIPLDVNFYKRFNHIEINYILDTFNELPSLGDSVSNAWNRDRTLFLQNLICHGFVGGQKADKKVATNLNNQPIEFSIHDSGSSMSVNGSTPSSRGNMVFDRGVAHSFSEIPFLPGAFQFNAEKYLHGMNSTDFVKELHFRNLQHMIKDAGHNLTIFVPEVADGEHQGFTKSSLLYHFVEYQLWLEEEFEGVNHVSSLTKTFSSAFCSSNKRLGGNCQRMRISKVEGSYIINDKYRISHAKPYEVGRTLIYTISEDLQLPGEFLSSLNPFYHCSKSLTFLRQLNLLDFPVNMKGYTVLLPCFDSWSHNDLTFEYLKNNVTAAELITKSLILQTLVYSDAGNDSIQIENMLGEVVSLSTYRSSDDRNGKIYFDLSNVANVIEVDRGLDSLFNQGVVHPLREAYFPKTVSITLRDLIQTTGATNFLELLESTDVFRSIVDESEAFSILVPTATSLDLEGITLNSTNLQDFLKLHIVNGTSTESLLKCSGSASTIFGESLTFRQSSLDTCWLRLESAANHEVRILRTGCSSRTKSCIFLIDRPLSLLWLNEGKKRLQLPGIAVGAGVLVGFVTMLAVFLCILLVFFGKSSRKPILIAPAEENQTDQVTRPLLADSDHSRRTPTSPQVRSPRFESTYSSNACVSAIDVGSSPR